MIVNTIYRPDKSPCAQQTVQHTVHEGAAWGRRTFALSALAIAAAGLAGCGGGTKTESTLVPTRFIAFGDGLTDTGQVSGTIYTVKDGSSNNWAQVTAANYGLTLTAQSAGGQNWARGNARIALKPDAAGNAATLTLAEQIDAFLATNTIGKDDVLLLGPGVADLVVLGDGVKAGTITSAEALANAQAAGKALAVQAKRLVAAGGKHVVVAAAYNLGKSPYATANGLNALLESASLKLNESLLIDLVNDGANVLYVDMAFRTNQLINQPSSNSFVSSSAAACTTPTAATCTPTTIVAGVTYDSYVFADDRYFTPAIQRLLGNYAAERMRSRW
jgi:outer membrane lipase/esterase